MSKQQKKHPPGFSLRRLLLTSINLLMIKTSRLSPLTCRITKSAAVTKTRSSCWSTDKLDQETMCSAKPPVMLELTTAGLPVVLRNRSEVGVEDRAVEEEKQLNSTLVQDKCNNCTKIAVYHVSLCAFLVWHSSSREDPDVQRTKRPLGGVAGSQMSRPCAKKERKTDNL